MSASDHVYSPPEAEPLMPYEPSKSSVHDEISLDSLDDSSAPASARDMALRRKKTKEESLLGMLRTWIVDHQIGLSLNLFILLTLTHICFPRARRRTRTFYELSYYDATNRKYVQGPDDLYFVAFWVVVFTGLRASIMQYILLPFAHTAGIRKIKTQVRFAEQAWLFLYYTVFWSLGMYIMYNSNYWLNLNEMWTNFPTREMDGLLKWYYLVQYAFWLQQILVVHIEERRKDHWQMFTHHLVTCTLLFTSYGYYQTKVGNVILCLMDVVDLVFPAAKMLKYTGFQTACDCAFAAFVVTWFVARHVLYLIVCWSIHVDVPKTMLYGCYDSITGEKFSSHGGSEVLKHILQPFQNPGGLVCFNERVRYSFLAVLLFLQGITLMWFAMIIRVVLKVLNGDGADDSRSDDGEEEGLEDSEEAPVLEVKAIPVQKPVVEHYVAADEINFKKRPSSGTRYRSRKSGTHGGGLSDRKELLGRIGCDKPS